MSNIEISPAHEVDNAIALISEGGMDKEEIVFMYDRLVALKQAAGDTVDRMKGAMVAWIEQNGDIDVGEIRYYAGHEKKVKPRNPNMAEFYKAVLIAVGGDEAAFASALAANAFKHGTIRKLLDESYGEEEGERQFELLFETVVTPKLEEGKPKKTLQGGKKFLK